MSFNARQALIAFVTFISGLYFFLEFMLPETLGGYKFGRYHEEILIGVQVVGSMAFGLGLINILRVHGARLLYGQRGWTNSFALILGMVLMFGVQTGEFIASQKAVAMWKPLSDMQPYLKKVEDDFSAAPGPAADKILLVAKRLNAIDDDLGVFGRDWLAENDPKAQVSVTAFQLNVNLAKEKTEQLRSVYEYQAKSGDLGEATKTSIRELTAELQDLLKKSIPSAKDIATKHFEQLVVHRTSQLLYQGFFVPLGAAMFALLAFYIANAAYRSFRLKTVEASVMMFTAIIIILGQIPFGPLYISEDLPAWRLWILKNINTPGNRAIYFGAAVGGFAMAVRMWLSLEKNPLETDEGR